MRILLVLCSLLFSGCHLDDDPSPADYRAASEATYVLQLYGNPRGTAVQIRPGVFLTVAHIMHGTPSFEGATSSPHADNPDLSPEPFKGPMWTLRQGGETHGVTELLHLDEEKDIVVLRADTTCPCVSVGDTPQEYAPVFTSGYPGPLAKALQPVRAPVVEGLFLGTVRDPKDGTLYLTSVYLSSGNSGGGLFAMQRGQLSLVGLAHAYPAAKKSTFLTVDHVKRYGLFVAAETIREALDEVFTLNCSL